MLIVCGLLLASSIGRAADAPNALSEEELNDGWILLFDGETTFGWKPTSDANWQVADGVISVLWLCASEKIAEAETLLAIAK